MVIAVLDENLRFVWVSVALYPLSISDVIGRFPWDFLQGKHDVESAKNRICRCFALGEPQRYFTTAVLADEQVVFHTRAEPIPHGVILVSRIVPADVRKLRDNDIEFLRAVGSGASQEALASQFHISQSAVSKHELLLRKRLGLTARKELVQLGLALE